MRFSFFLTPEGATMEGGPEGSFGFGAREGKGREGQDRGSIVNIYDSFIIKSTIKESRNLIFQATKNKKYRWYMHHTFFPAYTVR